MSDDSPPGTLDALQPVPRAHASGLPQSTVKHRRDKANASRGDFNAHAAVRSSVKTLKASGDTYGLVPPLTREEMLGMTTTLIRQFAGEAQGTASSGERLTSNGRKQAAIAFGVVVDKHSELQARPKPVIQAAEAETLRPAILSLAAKLAELDSQPAVESEQLPADGNAS